jgi:hypothetical protein
MNSFLKRSDAKQEVNLDQIEHRISKLEAQIEEIKSINLKNIQKVGMVRFNPFNETGGNMSFVLALLDGWDCGVVVTSLHGRGGTRVYAKPVIKGKGSIELSSEEERAIKIALNEKK